MAWATGMGAAEPSDPCRKLLERLAADVLHDDVSGALVLDEVVDPHDVGVLDLGQEAALGDGGRHGGLVTRVEETLQHHPAVGHVAVPGQVHPAHAAVRQAPGHLVLAGDEVAGRSFGVKEIARPAVRAVALGPPGTPVPAAADRVVAAGAATPVLGHLRIGHDDRASGSWYGIGAIIDQAGAQVTTGGGAARRLAGGPGRTSVAAVEGARADSPPATAGRAGIGPRRVRALAGSASGWRSQPAPGHRCRNSRLDGPVAARAAASHWLRSLSGSQKALLIGGHPASGLLQVARSFVQTPSGRRHAALPDARPRRGRWRWPWRGRPPAGPAARGAATEGRRPQRWRRRHHW